VFLAALGPPRAATRLWLAQAPRCATWRAPTRGEVPQTFASAIPLDAHQKGRRLTPWPRARLGMLDVLIGAALLLAAQPLAAASSACVGALGAGVRRRLDPARRRAHPERRPPAVADSALPLAVYRTLRRRAALRASTA